MKTTSFSLPAAGIAVIIGLTACDQSTAVGSEPEADSDGHTVPTAFTIEANREMLSLRPFADRRDFEDAQRGLIASPSDLSVTSADGGVIWDPSAYEFLANDLPDTINPSLQRQARLNSIHGLFRVTDGVFQLRGFGLANMSIIEGKSGWIIVDPLTAQESASIAFDFAREHLGDHPIRAIIFSHSHVDHFGGVLGLISAAKTSAGDIPIFAPQGFIEESTSENVIAGVAMGRRVMFMTGARLQKSPRGHVDMGLGKGAAFGTIGILEPTELIESTPQRETIDGVDFIFQNAPGSEAPAEMTFYLPDAKVFYGAELVSKTMHNIYTLRGAKVRDALRWSGYIDEAIRLFGEADIYFGSHHWPVWGNDRVIEFLKQQRDLYKYIHDQTLRLANAGLTPDEIAEEIALPASLERSFANLGYYGTLRHNARAVYQAYFGWFDGNPANLNPLPPVEAGKRYVRFMGGGDRLLAQAADSFEEGDYRWVAEVLNHLVMAEPDNADARELLARTYDQLGYQAESGVWRNFYLTAAYELRHGGPRHGISLADSITLLRHTPIEPLLDAMAVRLNGPEAARHPMTINMVFEDLDERFILSIDNGVLHHRRAAPGDTATATIRLSRDLYLAIATGTISLPDALASDDASVEGNESDVIRFFSLFEKPAGTFNIVTP